MKALQALLTIAAALALPTALTAQGYVYAIGNQSFSTVASNRLRTQTGHLCNTSTRVGPQRLPMTMG